MASPIKFISITNVSNQQLPIQVKRPGGDFYLEERQVRIGAGQTVVLPEDHLMPAQIENLKAKQQLQTAAA